MRTNIYAEEMTERVEIVSKEKHGRIYTGLRLYLETPATVNGQQYRGPHIHEGKDDSSAITFWGKRDLRVVLRKMLAMLDEHYEKQATPVVEVKASDFRDGHWRPPLLNRTTFLEFIRSNLAPGAEISFGLSGSAKMTGFTVIEVISGGRYFKCVKDGLLHVVNSSAVEWLTIDKPLKAEKQL